MVPVVPGGPRVLVSQVLLLSLLLFASAAAAHPVPFSYLDLRVDPRSGQPIGAYLDAVRKRFGQWILDSCRADYDDAWLAYQDEIGRRHHRSGKNKADGVSAAPHIPLRYLLALVMPISATMKPFLAKKGHSAAEVEAMHAAWSKSVLLQAILWSRPYVTSGDF